MRGHRSSRCRTQDLRQPPGKRPPPRLIQVCRGGKLGVWKHTRKPGEWDGIRPKPAAKDLQAPSMPIHIVRTGQRRGNRHDTDPHSDIRRKAASKGGGSGLQPRGNRQWRQCHRRIRVELPRVHRATAVRVHCGKKLPNEALAPMEEEDWGE